MSAASPSVIIPCLLPLMEAGHGNDKGLHTIIITACSAGDAVAISGFGIFLGIIFVRNNDLLHLILHGPIEVMIGLGVGSGWGLLARYIPHRGHGDRLLGRAVILLSGGLVSMFGSHLIHYDGAGAVSTITMAAVAGIQWRGEAGLARGVTSPELKLFRKIWLLLEPILFALIGTELRVRKYMNYMIYKQNLNSFIMMALTEK